MSTGDAENEMLEGAAPRQPQASSCDTAGALPLATDYLDPAIPLEDRLEAAFRELRIEASEQARLTAFLEPLRVKHEPTYYHSVRVALLASQIAAVQQMDRKALFYAGLLHDLGKLCAPPELLNKTDGWTAEDARAMQAHVLRGYEMVRGEFDFSGEIDLWHHNFQLAGYPDILPPPLHEYSAGTMSVIPRYGRMLALADCYDALHRINDHQGARRALNGEEIREALYRVNIDLHDLLDRLYKLGVLSTFIVGLEHRETAELDRDDLLYQASFRFTAEERTPANTQRHVMLAAALEPISDKEGCTTRFRDISRHLRLEYFITAAVNIGEAFGALGKAVSEACPGLPPIYDYACRAQLESKRNRRGGRVNQGMIELFTPIVAAQHGSDPRYELTAEEILLAARHVLFATSRHDVDQLVALKRTAYQLSHYDDREVPEHPEAQTVLEYYEHDLLASSGITGIAHNSEFLRGFPTVAAMAETLARSPYPFFSKRVEEAYHVGALLHDPNIGVGFLADCIAAAIYLRLSQEPQARLIG